MKTQIPCLFCSKPVKNFSLKNNYNEEWEKKGNSALKISLFCEAFKLTDDVFKTNLRKSPLCSNCFELIKNIAFTLKCIQEMEMKLNLGKENFKSLIQQEYRNLDSMDIFDDGFSPLQFRQEIRRELNLQSQFGLKKDPESEEGAIIPISDPFSESLPQSSSFLDVPQESAGDPEDEVISFEDLSENIQDFEEVDFIHEESSSESIESSTNPTDRSVTRDFSAGLDPLKIPGTNEGIVLEDQKDEKDTKIKQPFICSHIRDVKGRNCKQPFETEELLNAHIRRAHLLAPAGSKTCPDCGMSFGTRFLLYRHKIDAHGEPYPFICKEDGCNRGFITSTALKWHEYVHSGDWPFRCEICGTGCPSKKHVEQHKVTHVPDDEKSFLCEVCSKTFPSQKYLRRHQRFHEDERPYKCELCSSAFKCSGAVSAHMKSIHSSDRPNLCPICGRSYKMKKHLNAHLRNHAKRKETAPRKWKKRADLDEG